MTLFQLSFIELLFGKRTPVKARRAPPKRSSADVRRHHDTAPLILLWEKLVLGYFPERKDLLEYQISWSKRRQKRVLGSCHIGHRRVVIARELSYEEHAPWLEPLLYHEMCHAVLGRSVFKKGKRRQWHGREFKSLERRHPGIPALDQWIKSGGWAKAVRSARTREYHQSRRASS